MRNKTVPHCRLVRVCDLLPGWMVAPTRPTYGLNIRREFREVVSVRPISGGLVGVKVTTSAMGRYRMLKRKPDSLILVRIGTRTTKRKSQRVAS